MILNTGFIELTINGISFYIPATDFEAYIKHNARKYELNVTHYDYHDILQVSRNIYCIISGHRTVVGSATALVGTMEFVAKYFTNPIEIMNKLAEWLNNANKLSEVFEYAPGLIQYYGNQDIELMVAKKLNDMNIN